MSFTISACLWNHVFQFMAHMLLFLFPITVEMQGLYGFTSPHFSFSDHCKISVLKVVDCRICGDPHSVLRFAFIEFSDEGKCTQVTTPILSNI